MIDYKFISVREGGAALHGYVPNPGGSMSGVTCATGFDLGSRSVGDLLSMGLSDEIVRVLEPHLGKKGKYAAASLAGCPLKITEKQAEMIDKASKHQATDRLVAAYNASSKVPFASIPDAAQTCIASVAFQYGANLAARTPKFWAAVTKQDWPLAVAILNDFGDAYPTRRKLEADLIVGLT